MAHAAARPQTPGEEIANAASHALGAVLAAVYSPQLIGSAFRAGSLEGFAALIYCGSMILLFSVSAAYHALPCGEAKAFLRRLDHAAIFLFIAGSYTPLMLEMMADESVLWMLGLVWLVATAGTVAKCANRLTHPVQSTLVYLGLGWASVVLLQPLMTALPTDGVALIVAGGVLYSIGAVVFHFDDRIPYAHFAWHLLVLAASGCHFVAVLRYVVS